MKEYQDNKLVNCGQRKVTIEHNENYVKFLEMALKYKSGCFRDSTGFPYTYYFEINDSGLILSTIAPDKKSYIISTKGVCP